MRLYGKGPEGARMMIGIMLCTTYTVVLRPPYSLLKLVIAVPRWTHILRYGHNAIMPVTRKNSRNIVVADAALTRVVNFVAAVISSQKKYYWWRIHIRSAS